METWLRNLNKPEILQEHCAWREFPTFSAYTEFVSAWYVNGLKFAFSGPAGKVLPSQNNLRCTRKKRSDFDFLEN